MARVPKQAAPKDPKQAAAYYEQEARAANERPLGDGSPLDILLRFVDWAEGSADDAGVTPEAVEQARNALANLEKGMPATHGQAPGHASGVRQITVVWGEEHHQPVQYNGFRIGGLHLVADVRPTETVEEAHDRLFAMLDELGRKQFEQKLAGFLDRARQGAAAARKGSTR